MCDQASLTGSLSGGSKRAAQRYNSVLSYLVRSGNVPDSLFAPIPEDAGYGEIGVEARMLAGYLPSNREKNKFQDDNEKNILIRLAPFVGRDELGLLIREQIGKGVGLDMNTLSNLAPFLGQDILGELIRGHLDNRAKAQEEAPPEPTPPAPTPRETPSHFDYRLEHVSTEKDSVEDLLNLLKSPYLSDEERNSLVERLRTATVK